MKAPWFYMAFAIAMSSCTAYREGTDKQLTKTLSVVLDPTDPRVYWPQADKILELYHFNETPDAECIFRLQSITDKRLSPITTYRLLSADKMAKENINDDPQFRANNIVAYYEVIRSVMKKFYAGLDTSSSMSHSECFRSIANELVYLSKCNSDEKHLIVTSDLMENSDLLNCYTEPLDSTMTIVEKLNKDNLLPENLQGIKVTFLFNPRNRNEDKKFALLVEAYKILLQSKGVEIKILANL